MFDNKSKKKKTIVDTNIILLMQYILYLFSFEPYWVFKTRVVLYYVYHFCVTVNAERS